MTEVTEDVARDILAYLESGMDSREICKRLDVIYSQIMSVVAKERLPINDKEIIDLFQRGKTSAMISAENGMKQDYVSETIKKFYKSGRVSKSLLYDDEVFIKHILEAFSCGASIKGICTEFNLSIAPLRKILNNRDKYDFIEGSIVDPEISGDERADEISELLRQGYTLSNVGEVFGITRERVRQICNKFMSEDNYQAMMAESRIARITRRDGPVIKLLNEGLLVHQIIEKLNRTYVSIASVAKSCMSEEDYREWAVKNRKWSHGQAIHNNTIQKHVEVIELIRSGMSCKEVAKEKNYSLPGIYVIARKYLTEEEKAKYMGQKRKHLDIDKVLELYRSGLTQEKISKQLNYSAAKVAKTIHKHMPKDEIEDIQFTKRGKLNFDQKLEIADLYKQGWSFEDLAAKYQVSTGTIDKAITFVMGESERRQRGITHDYEILDEVKSRIVHYNAHAYQLVIQKVRTLAGEEKVTISSLKDNSRTSRNVFLSGTELNNLIELAMEKGILSDPLSDL